MTHVILTLAGLVLVTTQPTEPELPVELDLETIRALPVQHDGRWPPLDTVARDLVESVTGDAFYQGQDPVLLLLAWTFKPETWERQPLIAIENEQLRDELRLPRSKTVFSYTELVGHRHLHTLVEDLARVEGRKLDPLEAKVSDIQGKLVTLQAALHDHAIRPIPDPDDIGGAWRSIFASPQDRAADIAPARAAWRALREAFRAGDAAAFADASDRLVAALAALPAAHRPDPKLIATELRYNAWPLYRIAWIAMAVGAIFGVLAYQPDPKPVAEVLRAALRLFRLRVFGLVISWVVSAVLGVVRLVPRKLLGGLAVAAMIAGFAVLTYGLSLRWQIAGRIPAANMFESLLFLSWGMGAFAIVAMLVLRQRIVPLTASAMGALALILAEQAVPGTDHYIRPIAPVLLDTIWMSIHVPIIMVSYSVLALAVLIAHVQLVVMAVVPERRRIAEAIDSLHYWYVHVGAILLLAGIVTGSMWAASSWGRYWDWDPKEVWSLVAFLGYLAVLHVRVDREKVPRWAYAMAALLAIGVFALVVPKLAPLSGVKLLAFAGAAVALIVFLLARSQFATALKSVVAFWLIIMTYVGVNYVLGTGLHSYGFGTGAVARKMFLIGGIDLALIVVCGVVYVARCGWQSFAAPTPARTSPA